MFSRLNCRCFTYITEVGSVYLSQEDFRTVHDQSELCKVFNGTLLVEPLQEGEDEREMVRHDAPTTRSLGIM